MFYLLGSVLGPHVQVKPEDELTIKKKRKFDIREEYYVRLFGPFLHEAPYLAVSMYTTSCTATELRAGR